MKKRQSKITRQTKETNIFIKLNIDGKGESKIQTPINFLNHMLESFSKHGLFDLEIKAEGDIKVDQHHTIEDIGIVLGQAFKEALGDKKGINRSGSFAYPMDEALAVVAVDLGGRPFLKFDAKFKRRICGDLDTDILTDFFQGFSTNLGANIAIVMPYGRSDHHKIEAIFKAFAKALMMACERNARIGSNVLSTKGRI